MSKTTPDMNNIPLDVAEAWAALDCLKVKNGVPNIKQEAAIAKSEREYKQTKFIDSRIESVCCKQWAEMTQNEKETIATLCEGMDETEIQEFWDYSHYYMREKIIEMALNK